jgi:hypothetical protein
VCNKIETEGKVLYEVSRSIKRRYGTPYRLVYREKVKLTAEQRRNLTHLPRFTLVIRAAFRRPLPLLLSTYALVTLPLRLAATFA